jgi:SAM-dependent methyltransferase
MSQLPIDPVDQPDAQSYSLGHSHKELNRLSVQAHLIEPITKRFFLEAGIAPGMRVLDVGSGAGDVALLAAQLVGAEGEVVGTDRSAAPLETARARVAAMALANVTFLEGDPTEMAFEEPFDAVVGRYVLMYQRDPAAMLRKLIAHLMPGGAVVFHEPYRDGIRSFPPVPAYDRGWELVDETFRRSGADPTMGIKLHTTFLAAGLPAPSMRMESVIGGGTNSADQVHFEMDVVETLAPEIRRLEISTDEGDDLETWAERTLTDVIANNSVIVGRAEVGAWSRIPVE